MTENVKALAKDLTKEYPSSPHLTLGRFVIAARTLDKCRSQLAGTIGEYHYDCPLDNVFFNFAGITSDDFKDFVATGADDEAVGKWIQDQTDRSEDVVKIWNLKMRQFQITDLPFQNQLFLEGYIQENIPQNRRVYTWFDVYDLEEGVI